MSAVTRVKTIFKIVASGPNQVSVTQSWQEAVRMSITFAMDLPFVHNSGVSVRQELTAIPKDIL